MKPTEKSNMLGHVNKEATGRGATTPGLAAWKLLI